ncbi:MAG: Ig-like domain-containing protein, partial [Planctomycetia bacterium]|nr:Ig-like domain-containing protein [Planctomycetia bacterium]
MRRRMTRGRAGRAIRQVLPFFFERLEQRTLLAVSPALLNSWFVSGQGQFAEVYVGQTGGAVVGPSTTWTTQTSPVIGDVQKVSFSSATNTVYVNTPDLASYVMGAWWGNAAHTTPFQNLPKDQNAIYKITLNEAYPSFTHSLAGGGAIGIAVNGVSLFNAGDAFSYSHASSSEVGPPSGDGLFNRLAAAVESVTFDVGNGHQPQTGEYHYHEDPIALRAQLDDNVDYVGTTNYFPYDPAVYYLTHGEGSDGDFSEVTTALHHSPIIGWAFDGYPIYGPYGYSDSNDPASAVTRIQSSFSLRSITTRTTLPGWAAQLSGAKLGASATSTSADGVYTMTTAQQGLYAGPAVSTTYPLGRYGEDYAYVPGAGNLDQFNGRWCRTPEFPNGTYAYFTTIDAAGEPAFPYLFGRQYYGQKNGSGKVASITEAVTVSFNVATNTAPIVSGPASFSLKQSATAALTGGLQFGMSDVDEATVESVALAVTAGTLTFDLTGPLASRVSIVSGGNRTGAVTISGAVDELNAAFATLTYTAPTSGTSATLTVQANDGSAANNLSSVFTSTIAIEATNPSIAIASSMSTLNAVQTAAITFTLSAAATNFTVTDVSVAGGVLSGFTGSGTSYTATFTPTANLTGTGTVSVVAGAFAGSLSPAIAIDTVAPTIAIASSASSLRAGQIATITFTLSETSTSFTAADVAVTGGTLSGFAGSGASYSATFTPTAGSTTPGTISVAAGAFTDATGNQNTAGSLSPAIAIDTVAPTIAIASSASSLRAGQNATITFTLSETSTSFTAADVAVTGGTLSGFAGS